MCCFSRSDAVRQTLCRHVTLKNSVESEKERFVVDKLHVPIEWIHEAKVQLHSYVLFCSFMYGPQKNCNLRSMCGFDLNWKITWRLFLCFSFNIGYFGNFLLLRSV